MQGKLSEEFGEISDLTSEIARPRLMALLFCDWANQTADNKSNLIGTFDRIFVGPDSKLTPPFTLFIRLAQVTKGPVQIRIIGPDGKIGLDGAIQPEGVTVTEGEPVYVQAMMHIQFEAELAGIYWFDVSYQGQSLGGASLMVQLRNITDATLTAQTITPASLSQTTGQGGHAQIISFLAMRGAPPATPNGGWQATVGMFEGDPAMDRIIEAGRRIRGSERHE